MIAKIKKAKAKSVPAWHAAFLKMLPAIQRQAKIAFRHLDREAREEAVEEVTAYAVIAFKGLWDRGKAELAYPSVLALYGIKRVKIGRRVGTSLNVKDISSEYCQLRKHLTVERLDKYDADEGCWVEVLVEDRRAGPAETAASRIDFPAWLDTLSRRDRKIAMKLGAGEKTSNVARLFRVSQGRISQLRRELHAAWLRFHGEAGGAAAVSA